MFCHFANQPQMYNVMFFVGQKPQIKAYQIMPFAKCYAKLRLNNFLMLQFWFNALVFLALKEFQYRPQQCRSFSVTNALYALNPRTFFVRHYDWCIVDLLLWEYVCTWPLITQWCDLQINQITYLCGQVSHYYMHSNNYFNATVLQRKYILICVCDDQILRAITNAKTNSLKA